MVVVAIVWCVHVVAGTAMTVHYCELIHSAVNTAGAFLRHNQLLFQYIVA